MTDKEIIKALELCFAEKGTNQTCGKCPYHQFGELCKANRDRDAFDLFNRQQAEIERLKEELLESNIEIAELYKCKFSAENVAQNIVIARKDILDSLEYEILHYEFWNKHSPTSEIWNNGYMQCQRDVRKMICTLVKEMVGDE